MDGPAVTDSTFSSGFIFPEEFIGFQGHFPSKKVLPGACQIQCVVSTIEKGMGRRVALKEIMLAKYTAPIFPGDNIVCTVSGDQGAGGEIVYKARVTKGAEKVTDMKLRVLLRDKI